MVSFDKWPIVSHFLRMRRARRRFDDLIMLEGREWVTGAIEPGSIVSDAIEPGVILSDVVTEFKK